MIDCESQTHWTGTTTPTSPPSSSTSTTSDIQQHEQHQQYYPSDLLTSLRQHSLFQRTNNEAFLTKLATSMHVRIYNPRDIIISKGEASKAMFFLLRGEVEVCSADFERIYATLPQGSCFGEIGILYAMPRTATVVASLKCTVAALTSEQVHSLLPQFPDVEKIIRHEAEERMALMEKSEQQQEQLEIDQQQQQQQLSPSPSSQTSSPRPKSIDSSASLGERHQQQRSSVQNNVESFSKTGIRTHLEKIPFFFGCPEDFLHLICLSIQPRNYGPNTVIFNQDDQGDEMYFIVDGSVDIKTRSNSYGRLGPGGYFGDTSVLLNIPRATTVQTVTQVELYVLNRVNLQQVCDLFPDTGARLKTMTENKLQDLYEGKFDEFQGIHPTALDDIQPQSVCRTTCDQDPTLPITPATQLRKIETRKRRASVAVWNDPLLSQHLKKEEEEEEEDEDHKEMLRARGLERPISPSPSSWAIPNTPPDDQEPMELDAMMKTKSTFASPGDRLTTLDPSILVRILTFLDFGSMIRMMRLNKAACLLFFAKTSALLHDVDLSTIHKRITDDTFASLMHLIRRRLRSLCLSQCFHLTDLGFRTLLINDDDDAGAGDDAVASPDTPPHSALDSTPSLPAPHLGEGRRLLLQHLHTLDLNSCWLLTDKSLQLLGETCPQLKKLDLSNCRKITNVGMYRFLEAKRELQQRMAPTKVPGLEWLSLSYCKNLNNVTMQHLADYTRDSLMYLNLQRCTKITDPGFAIWAAAPDGTVTGDAADSANSAQFTKLKELVLVDCSFLTDRAIQLLTSAAPGLERLCLSFCCSLSDSAMTYLALLPHLTDLDVSFCGAAVSDLSLKALVDFSEQTPRSLSITAETPPRSAISRRVSSLRRLNIRGCVRVTGNGLLSFLATHPFDKAAPLEELNVSQCPCISMETKKTILDHSLVQHLSI
ncbi:hypothetical protein BCR42DRAFT_350720 [Absidia repens]|uniref:Cyclic nucleotide-binding domain-containing protein n=1 Tax=Absidia repens TaxID=90262 RepID=A0A1X2IKT0_9FUNG|nr:hypothetical protein BCR42DRAFT_350720 [Absidia repens]